MPNISIMDYLLQKDDIMDDIKNEMDISTSFITNDNFIDPWATNPEDFLNSILKDEIPFDGVLSDPQHDNIDSLNLSTIGVDDEELMGSTLSSPGPSVSEIGRGRSTSPSRVSDVSANGASNNGSPKYHSSSPQSSDLDQSDEIKIEDVKFIPEVKKSTRNHLQTVTIINQKNIERKLSGKVIRIQNGGGNGGSKITTINKKPILLPVSMVKDLRTIKIINPRKPGNNIKITANILPQRAANNNFDQVFAEQLADNTNSVKSLNQNSSAISYCATMSSDEDNASVISSTNSSSIDQQQTNATVQYPRLHLTEEEQKLLAKEGIQLPEHYPLTKQEERELKRIRRKIRNKISAQDSRKRKKEYVDGLEERVKQCTDENQTLVKRIKILQTQNQTLVAQLRRLQALVTRKLNAAAQPSVTTQQTATAPVGRAQPATCLMVLLLSLALVAMPSLKRSLPTTNDLVSSGGGDLATQTAGDQTKLDDYISSRTLLYKDDDLNEDDLNMEEFLNFNSAFDSIKNLDASKDSVQGGAPPTKKSRLSDIKEEELLNVWQQLVGGGNGDGNSLDGGGGNGLQVQSILKQLHDIMNQTTNAASNNKVVLMSSSNEKIE